MLASGLSLYHGWTPPPLGKAAAAVSAPDGCNTSAYDVLLPTLLGGFFPALQHEPPVCTAWKLAATVCLQPPTLFLFDAATPLWQCARAGGVAAGGFADPLLGGFCAVRDLFSVQAEPLRAVGCDGDWHDALGEVARPPLPPFPPPQPPLPPPPPPQPPLPPHPPAAPPASAELQFYIFLSLLPYLMGLIGR